jgi:hypothetical protein
LDSAHCLLRIQRYGPGHGPPQHRYAGLAEVILYDYHASEARRRPSPSTWAAPVPHPASSPFRSDRRPERPDGLRSVGLVHAAYCVNPSNQFIGFRDSAGSCAYRGAGSVAKQNSLGQNAGSFLSTARRWMPPSTADWTLYVDHLANGVHRRRRRNSLVPGHGLHQSSSAWFHGARRSESLGHGILFA